VLVGQVGGVASAVVSAAPEPEPELVSLPSDASPEPEPEVASLPSEEVSAVALSASLLQAAIPPTRQLPICGITCCIRGPISLKT
jgi:hypothetical protein